MLDIIFFYRPYNCICHPGFTGTNCEININDCVGITCQNQGTCVDGINHFSCQCLASYGGEFCEQTTAYCLQNPCKHGGICTDKDNGVGEGAKSCHKNFYVKPIKMSKTTKKVSIALSFFPECFSLPSHQVKLTSHANAALVGLEKHVKSKKTNVSQLHVKTVQLASTN